MVLSGGSVVDGTGAPPRRADVGLAGDRIVAVGDDLDGRRRLDVDGFVVAPGFVDAHCHTDVAVVDAELTYAALAQGVTTQVVGNCGWSAFPCREGDESDMTEYARPLLGGTGVWAQRDVTAYHELVARAGPWTNIATLVGHGMLRRSLLGLDERPATPEERAELARSLRAELGGGAVGMSAGLVYAPSAYADTDELSELLTLVGEVGGTFAVHMRNEGERLLENLEANVELAERSGVRLQISHLKAAGRTRWATMPDALRVLEAARARGVDVAFDVYPYEEASSLLRTVLPPWALAGGVDALLARLGDPDERRRIADELEAPTSDGEDLVSACGWDGIRVVGLRSERFASFEGTDLATIAAASGTSTAEALLDVLLAERGEPLAMLRMMHLDDVEAALAHPLAVVGSDGIPANRQGHPRLYNTYLRVFDRYIGSLLRLEDAVHRCSAAPAARFGLADVGRVVPGARADLVVFDPDEVREFDAFPRRDHDPSPMTWVFLGGVDVIADHHATPPRPGAVLTRS